VVTTSAEPDDGESPGDVGKSAARPTAGFVQSFERGLAVLIAFDMDHPELTASEVARRAGVTRAAARRLLLTLVELGYVRTDGRLFSLRPKVLCLGFSYLSSLGLPQLAMPALSALADETNESAYLSVLDDTETVCVANVPKRRIWSAAISVGTRFPAFATAAGRVILASMSEPFIDEFLASAQLRKLTEHTITEPAQLKEALIVIADRGWAIVDHELEVGLRTVAVPVRDATGRVVAAVSASTPALRLYDDSPDSALLPALADAAASIEQDLREQHRSSLR
jgi:IclR family pca regulon transcriptional regulator